MSETTRPAVVVGIDQSDCGRAAVQYAADLAQRQHRPLRVVHAFEASPYSVRPQVARSTRLTGAFRSAGEDLCTGAVEGLTVTHPDVDVTVRLQAGNTVETLLEESDSAEVVVLGRRGLGDFTSLLLGSTTLQVASHADCPVITVPEPKKGDGTRHGIVVGIDGSEASSNAVGFAYQTASDLGEPLVLVHTWFDMTPLRVATIAPGVPYDLTSIREDQHLIEADEELLFAESVAGWSEKYPDVAVERKMVRGHPVQAMVDESGSARLLVVGCRGRGSLRSLALGSVSHGVLHHASGPVAVVR